MFVRGQRFVVIDSSAKKRQHPNVGDIGYLRNAVLFKDIFNEQNVILADAFFSKFSGDEVPSRSEKKRFALANNLNDESRQAMLHGVASDRLRPIVNLVMEDIVRCLTTINYNLRKDISDHPHTLFPTGFHDCMDNPKTYKAVICKIAPTFPTQIHKDRWEREAWIKSISRTISDISTLAAITQVPKQTSENIFSIVALFNRHVLQNKHGKTSFVGSREHIEPDTLSIIRRFHFLQSFVMSIVQSSTNPNVEFYKNFLNLRRRYNDYNAALDHIYEEV